MCLHYHYLEQLISIFFSSLWNLTLEYLFSLKKSSNHRESASSTCLRISTVSEWKAKSWAPIELKLAPSPNLNRWCHFLEAVRVHISSSAVPNTILDWIPLMHPYSNESCHAVPGHRSSCRSNTAQISCATSLEDIVQYSPI